MVATQQTGAHSSRFLKSGVLTKVVLVLCAISANAKLRETRKGVILAVAKAFPACAWAREVASEGLWGALPLAGPGRRVAARRRIAQPPRAIALGELPSAAIE